MQIPEKYTITIIYTGMLGNIWQIKQIVIFIPNMTSRAYIFNF